MEDHSRQELLEEYFSSSGVGAPEGVEGFIWLKVKQYLCFWLTQTKDFGSFLKLKVISYVFSIFD